MNRGKLGHRGCWVRIRGPVCNLLIIGLYLPPQYSRQSHVVTLRKLKELLRECGVHDCVIILGDFNVRLPRCYRDIIGRYAHRQVNRKMSMKKKEILSILARNGLCAINTYFRPKKRQTIDTWKRKGANQRGQIDYVMASKRWRSCFTDAKVVWSHARFKHGEFTDHGMVKTTFRWRLRRRRATPRINWRALKPQMTLDVNPVQVNQVLTDFDNGCQARWQEQDQELTLAGRMKALNTVTVSVAESVIPPTVPHAIAKLVPSERSKAFAEERAKELERGVTPQRRAELHRKMGRHRRADYRQCISKPSCYPRHNRVFPTTSNVTENTSWKKNMKRF